MIAFASWSVADIAVSTLGISNWSNFTIVVTTLLLIPALGNFIPIAIVFYTHFSNVTST